MTPPRVRAIVRPMGNCRQTHGCGVSHSAEGVAMGARCTPIAAGMALRLSPIAAVGRPFWSIVVWRGEDRDAALRVAAASRRADIAFAATRYRNIDLVHDRIGRDRMSVRSAGRQ